MKIEDVKNLLEEIGLDEDGYGYIDCNTASDYTDNHQYERIIAALKQNVGLQQINAELNKKLEEVEKQGMESLLQIENLIKRNSDIQQEFIIFRSELCEYMSKLKNIDFPIRIGNYKLEVVKNMLVCDYDSIEEPEPIELKLKITENSDKTKACPICNKKIGKYPAISREDNKTKICSNCGTLEALKAFKESLKDDEVNEKDI